MPTTTPSRRGITKTLVVLIIMVVVVGSAAAGFVLLPQLSGSSQNPAVLEFLSGAFGVVPSSNGTGYQVSPLFFVRNIADKPIVSLTAVVAGLPTLQFLGYRFGSVNSSNPLYPNESTNNWNPATGANEFYTKTAYTNGTQYAITFTAALADGTTSRMTQDFIVKGSDTLFTPSEYLSESSCNGGTGRNDTFPISTLAYSVNNASATAAWTVSVRIRAQFPIVSLVAGVNNGTIWFPFTYNGQPVSPKNPLPANTNVTQTFTWTPPPSRNWSRVIAWVGVCVNENAITSTSVRG